MLIANQFETTDGRTVTQYLTKRLWKVTDGKCTRTFWDFVDYMRYMTEV
ncbi:hypothetical protein [Lactococcus lactis]|uniref:Uncharacterized protein n=1 Tax=Lactococcus lactis TaxID=1358 RepID=A0AAW5TRP0_9LACT|nr:hypothetical protein [Lactococcus lactis]MCW2281473.1 hypothetical protein [Lactococcus lactis]